MLTAVTHTPSATLENCELTFLGKDQIDADNAAKQHISYGAMLRGLGVNVIALEKNSHLPDSVFVEDTAIVLDEIAIITSMGAKTRRTETELIASELGKYKPLSRIEFPATIEGGDVLRIGKKLFVGVSTRTNTLGINALKEIVSDLGYEVIPVDVSGCLHLKTGCTALDDSTVLINSNWVDRDAFCEFERIEVPHEEPFAANILRVKDTICIHRDFLKTQKLIDDLGYDIQTVDISEFQKAEAGLTCMSIIF